MSTLPVLRDDVRRVLPPRLWVPHGREAMPEEAGADFGAQVGALFATHADRVEQLGEAMAAVHPAEPHEHLWLLGVGRPGRAPRVPGGDHPRSRSLYERHGFVAAAPIAASGGPPLWPMWRPAA